MSKKPADSFHVDVVGLGYVGANLFLYLNSKVESIHGIDLSEKKVRGFKNGNLSFFEPGAQKLLDEGIQQQRMNVETQLHPHCQKKQRIYLICVGTPPNSDGSVNLTHAISVLGEIAQCIKTQPDIRHTIVLRSTVPPKTCEEKLLPYLQSEHGLSHSKDFTFYFFPEFLREGSALSDIARPSLFIVGSGKQEIHKEDIEFFTLFPGHNELQSTEISVSEMLKYMNNSFHALKVGFANEIASLSKSFSISTEQLFNLFHQDKILNISSAYLNPGFAFGGPCLVKELQAIDTFGRARGVKTPLISNLLLSNNEHVNRFLSLLESFSLYKVAFVGITFKPETDDYRESPLHLVIKKLLKKRSYQERYEVSIFDHPLTLERLNDEFSNQKVQLVDNADHLFSNAEVIILGPKKLTSAQISLLDSFAGPIINLNWHQQAESIKNKENYYSFP